MPETDQWVPFVTRVRIRNYKSIAECDVTLGPLTVLLGLNAAGKSNFLDALRFVSDALTATPAQAIAERGGLASVARQSADPSARTLRIELDLNFDSDRVGPVTLAKEQRHAGPATYGFELGRDGGSGAITVEREWCRVGPSRSDEEKGFLLRRGQVVEGPDYLAGPAADAASLLLPAAARWEPFAAVNAALHAMSFYAVNPTVMRLVKHRTGSVSLGPSGERIGEVLGYLAQVHPAVKQRVDDYVAAIVPGALGVDDHPMDRYDTIRLRVSDPTVAGGVRVFDPESMSDGTLSATGLLVALFQPATLNGEIPLVAIEEPELGLHPTAGGTLFDALTEAAEHVQVIAATQSADLLDRKDFPVDSARVVHMRDNVTHIEEVDDGSREAVSRGLTTLGELLRSNQLTPRQPSPRPATPE